MSKTVFMFPGQGSQYVGMRSKLMPFDSAQELVFSDTEAILEEHICKLMDEGPEKDLTRTSNAQPALLSMEMAWNLELISSGYSPDIVMGHSLGEYSALVVAGVLSFYDALNLVRTRGLLMEQAVKNTPGKMAAVIAATEEKLVEVVKQCASHGVVEITNFNSPKQMVLSGEVNAVDEAIKMVNENRIGKAIELNVSAPFHSSMMTPIAQEFAKYLMDTKFYAPKITFIDNVTGQAESDPDMIRAKLISQLDHPVMWEKSVLSAKELGGEKFIECGPGAVLSGLVKRIFRGAEIITGEKVV